MCPSAFVNTKKAFETFIHKIMASKLDLHDISPFIHKVENDQTCIKGLG